MAEGYSPTMDYSSNTRVWKTSTEWFDVDCVKVIKGKCMIEAEVDIDD